MTKRGRNKLIAALSVATVAALTTGGFAVAQAQTENDAVASSAKAALSLTQAIGAAESSIAGRATRAELDDERGSVAYEVEIAGADGKVYDVRIDATDGHVLSKQEDRADRSEAHGEED